MSGLSRPLAGATLLLGTMLFLSGCGGGPKGVVKGKITANNKPVVATVVFISTEGKALPAVTSTKEGTYVCEKVPYGKYKVAVSVTTGTAGPPATVKNVTFGPGKDKEGNVGKGPPADKMDAFTFFKQDVKVDQAKYGDAEKSGLSVDVNGSETVYDIPLK